MAKAVNIARSHRLDGIGEYYFSRRLREIAEIEAATGRQIVKLAMGSPDLPPHQSVIDRLAKEAQRPDVHKYMSYKGEPILRKAFADWYKKWYRTELDYNNEVLPLIGSKEGIMHICMTFLNKGDKVLVPNPGYPTYSAAVRLSGGEMVPYALLDALGCKYREHQAGLFVWAELPESYEGDSFAFSDEVMDKCDVFLTPGGIFGSEGNRYIRITLCCPEELLKKATDNIIAKFGK